MIRIAVLDDNLEIARQRAGWLREAGLPIDLHADSIVVFPGARALIEACERRDQPDFFDVILTDVFMPTPEEGGILIKEWLAKKRRSNPDYLRVQLRWISRQSDIRDLMTEHITLENESWLSAPSEGTGRAAAYYFCAIAGNAIRLAGGRNFEANEKGELVVSSKAMQSVMAQVARYAGVNAGVLIVGETGTGKEVIARAIHQISARKSIPMVTTNCAAIPSDLIESHLFGHLRGSFTGATEKREGKFQQAHRGTLFLDEIGELTMAAQAKLLRVLQEGEVEPIGGNTVKVDVRVIAATHRDLRQMVSDGKFREDLFYRLPTVDPVKIPPLRERRDDIEPLAKRFIELSASEYGKGVPQLSPAALAALEGYHWPGNVRELKGVINASILRLGEERTTINLEDLPRLEATHFQQEHELDLTPEEQLLRGAMLRADFNMAEVGRNLGKTRQAVEQYLKHPSHGRLKEIIDQDEREHRRRKAELIATANRRKQPPNPTIRGTDLKF